MANGSLLNCADCSVNIARQQQEAVAVFGLQWHHHGSQLWCANRKISGKNVCNHVMWLVLKSKLRAKTSYQPEYINYCWEWSPHDNSEGNWVIKCNLLKNLPCSEVQVNVFLIRLVIYSAYVSCIWPAAHVSIRDVDVWAEWEAAGWALADILRRSATCFTNELSCFWMAHYAIPPRPCCARWWSVCRAECWAVLQSQLRFHFLFGLITAMEKRGFSQTFCCVRFDCAGSQDFLFGGNFICSPKITADGSELPQHRG